MAKRAWHAVGALMMAALLTAIFAATGVARTTWPSAAFPGADDSTAARR